MYDRFRIGGIKALEVGAGWPGLDRIRADVRDLIVALNKPELSPGDLTAAFTDTESHVVSEASISPARSATQGI